MIAKVGRSHPMLICTDCGLPMDQRESKAMARQRLWSAVTLMVMATVGGAMALLATMNEVRTARPLEEGWERKEDGAAAEGQEKSGPGLMEPSGLMESGQRPAGRLVPRQTGVTERISPVSAKPDSAAKKAVAESSEKEPKHNPQGERKP